MVRGRQGSGVEPLKNTIRVRFTWMGVRETVTLMLKPTPANIRAAEALMERVRRAIEHGTFRHEEFFPHLAQPAVPKVVHLFSEYAKLWIDSLTVEHKTHRFYRSGVNFWLPRIGGDAIESIKQSTLKTHLAEAAKTRSAQAVNCYLLAARGVFALAVADGVLERDPTKGLKNHRVKLKAPDPLTREERDTVLQHMSQRYDLQVSNYFEFCFTTGMRPEEVIALRWDKIDWTKRTALVDAARVDGRDKDTKTHVDRTVDLTERAMDVLKRQKAFTFLKGLASEVFANPATGRAWRDTASQLKDYWHPSLKALGIRGRVAYQTRHTFASLALVEGVNVVYLAKQLGHSPMICLRHYGTWIPGEDNGREKAKLEAAHGQFRGQLGQSRATEGNDR